MFTAKFTINSNNDLLKKRGLENKGRVQKYVDKEVIRLMTQYTPKKSGELIRSATRVINLI